MLGAAEGIAVEDDHNQRDVSSDVTLVDSNKVVIFDDFDIGVLGRDGVHGEGHQRPAAGTYPAAGPAVVGSEPA
jgi:hypothetical protein